MNSQGITEHWREPFPESETASVLTAILRCGARLKKRFDHEHENPLSDRLLELLDADPLFQGGPLEVDREVPVYRRKGGRRTSKVAGKPDFRFVHTNYDRRIRARFEVEAKRLHAISKSGRLEEGIGEYVTTARKKPEREQGMMCFITGRYSHGLRAGAMLGYVFDGDLAHARASIAKSIEKHSAKLRRRSDGGLRVSNIVPDNSEISESLHDLADEVDINDPAAGHFCIYHLLVAV